MKKATLTILTIALAIMTVSSCGNAFNGGKSSKDSITFDSIKVDSTLPLGNKEGGPS